MNKRLAVVIGVGAEIGLGAELCRRFASEGLHVLIAGRTPSKLAQVVRSISAAGGSAEAVPMAARRLVPLGRGTVVFTGASASLRGKPGYAQFAAAEAGLRMIAQSMAREYGPYGSMWRM